MGSNSSKTSGSPTTTTAAQEERKQQLLAEITSPLDSMGVLMVASAIDAANFDRFITLHPAVNVGAYTSLKRTLSLENDVQTVFWLLPDSPDEVAAAIVVSRDGVLPTDDGDGSSGDDGSTTPSFSSSSKRISKKRRNADVTIVKVALGKTGVQRTTLAKAGSFESGANAALNFITRGYRFRTSIRKMRNTAVGDVDFSVTPAGLRVGLYTVFTRAVVCLEEAVSRGEVRPIESGAAGADAHMNLGLLLSIAELCAEQPRSGALAINPGRSVLLTSRNTPAALQPLVLLLQSTIFKIQYDFNAPQIASLRSAMIRLSGVAAHDAGMPGEEAASIMTVIGEIAEISALVCRLPFSPDIIGATQSLMRASPVLRGDRGRQLTAAGARRIAVHSNDGYFMCHVWIAIDPTIHTFADLAAIAARTFHGIDADPAVFRAFDALGRPITDVAQLHPNEAIAVNFGGESSFIAFPLAAHPTVPGIVFNAPSPSSSPDTRATFSTTSSTAAAKGHPIPEAPGAAVVGSIGDVQALGIHSAMNKWIAAHGDIVRVMLLGNPTYAIRRAAFAVAVLSARNKLAPATNIGGGHDGIFFADGETHCMLRQHFNEKFYDTQLRKMYPGILEMTNRFVDVLHERAFTRNLDIRMWDFSVKLFFDLMCGVGLGAPSKACTLTRPAEEAPEILELFSDILDLEKGRQIAFGAGLNFLNSLPTAKNRAYDAKVSRIYQLAEEFLVEYRETKAALGDRKPPCFMDACVHFASLPDADQRRLGRASVLNFLRAGSDTTAATLTWTTMLLSLHPHVERRLLDEIDRVFPDDSVQPTPDNIQKSAMPWLDAVIKESMRLHPPANVLLRGLVEDLELKTPSGAVGSDGATYVLPKGSRVLIDIIGLHKDPRYYANPERFDPERFADPDRYRAMEQGQFIPFGGGPRTCIGNLFGMLEVKTALIQLYRKYRFVHLGDDIRVREGEEQKPISGDRLRMIVREARARGGSSAVAASGGGDELVVQRQGSSCVFPVSDEHAPSPTASVASSLVDADVVVLYGGNQGTCEGLALKLGTLCTSLNIRNVQVQSLDSLRIDDLFAPSRTPRIALVLCSTYNGAPPANAANFVKAIREHFGGANSDRGSYLRFAVFGAGNSNWGATYQRVPNEIDRHLGRCGSARLLPLGLGDACDGSSAVLEAFNTWAKLVRRALLDALHIKEHSPPSVPPPASASSSTPPKRDVGQVAAALALNVTESSGVFVVVAADPADAQRIDDALVNHGVELFGGDESESGMGQPVRSLSTVVQTVTASVGGYLGSAAEVGGGSVMMPMRVVVNNIITGPSALRPVRHIELEPFEADHDDWDADNLVTEYETGDHLEVLTKQPTAVVATLLALLELPAKSLVKLRLAPNTAPCAGVPEDEWVPLPTLLGSRDLRLSASALTKLAPLASDPRDVALLQLAAEHPAVYESMFAAKGVWGLHEVATVAPSLRWTLPALLLCTTPLKNRYYSIASASGTQLSITVGVVEDARPAPMPPYHGLCSTALACCDPSAPMAFVAARVAKSTFRMPPDPHRSFMVLVAGGTGIAPMRGFLLDLQRRGVKGRCALYFGCRCRDELLYGDLLDQLVADGVIANLRVALSREPGAKKQYVQDLLSDDTEAIHDAYVNDDAHFYVCGGAKTVGNGLTDALEQMFARYPPPGRAAITPRDAVAELLCAGRLQLDVW